MNVDSAVVIIKNDGFDRRKIKSVGLLYCGRYRTLDEDVDGCIYITLTLLAAVNVYVVKSAAAINIMGEALARQSDVKINDERGAAHGPEFFYSIGS